MNTDGLPDDHDSLPGVASPAQATRLFGHDAQAGFLARAWRSGKMHHALLFTGEQGIGKASMAFMLARHVLSHPVQQNAPDHLDDGGDDETLRQVALGVHPQVLHLTRPLDPKTEKFKTQLTVDETRKIGHFLSRTVTGGGWRVVIVDPANDMNANAANALLKNLEEPTARTLFILIAHAAGRLLPTIRSRCLPVRFQTLDDAAMHDALSDIGIEATPEMCALSGGSPRMAAMLALCGGMEVIKAAETIVSTARFDVSGALKLGEVLAQRESEPLFVVVCNHLKALVADRARDAAMNGGAEGSGLAGLHQSLTLALSEAGRFNLDKRQIILDVLKLVHDALPRSLAG